MGVKITDRITPDGIKFQKMLKELEEKEVRIGFQHGEATEEDGTDICDIAAYTETYNNRFWRGNKDRMGS